MSIERVNKEFMFRYEPVAQNARRRWIEAGYTVSLMSYDAARDAFVFDVYNVAR